jgi:FtsP/CotA-like multicopper oxidase with cupredoxin domain
MRIPVALALAVPVVVVTSGLAVYSFARPVSSQVRTYYIAADQVPFPTAANGRAGTGQGRITREAQYFAAVYREYTDSTFTREKARPAEWKHLAFLGPLIRADVGDTVRVVFRNRVSFPANVHPDAVLHHPDAQDALSASTASGSALGSGADGDDAGVAPGGTRVYTWAIPTAAGPGADDHGSVLWLYHSQTGTPSGGDAGLIGPMIVYKRGALR